MCTVVSHYASDVAIVVITGVRSSNFYSAILTAFKHRETNNNMYNQPPRLPKVSPQFYFLSSRSNLLTKENSNENRRENTATIAVINTFFRNYRQSGTPYVYVLTKWSRVLNVSKRSQVEHHTC